MATATSTVHDGLMKEKYLLQKLHVPPTRGTAAGSVRRRRLLAGEHKSREETTHLQLFTLEVSSRSGTY